MTTGGLCLLYHFAGVGSLTDSCPRPCELVGKNGRNLYRSTPSPPVRGGVTCPVSGASGFNRTKRDDPLVRDCWYVGWMAHEMQLWATVHTPEWLWSTAMGYGTHIYSRTVMWCHVL